MELLGSHDDDAAVAGAQVEHLLARLEAAELEHLLDDDLRRRIVGRELLGVRVLRRQRGATEHCKQPESWHNPYVSRTVNNLPPCQTASTITFPRNCGKACENVPCNRGKMSVCNGFETFCTEIQQFIV